jgi:hypothetical protein
MLVAMSYRLLTCPETAHLEMIEQEIHPLGLLVVACSRFRPSCVVDCARTCARRLDRQARRGDSDNEATVEDDVTLDDQPTQAEITRLDLHPRRRRERGIDLAIETDVTGPGDETRLERPAQVATGPR